jgi:hypothetical protein
LWDHDATYSDAYGHSHSNADAFADTSTNLVADNAGVHGFVFIVRGDGRCEQLAHQRAVDEWQRVHE